MHYNEILFPGYPCVSRVGKSKYVVLRVYKTVESTANRVTRSEYK